MPFNGQNETKNTTASAEENLLNNDYSQSSSHQNECKPATSTTSLISPAPSRSNSHFDIDTASTGSTGSEYSCSSPDLDAKERLRTPSPVLDEYKTSENLAHIFAYAQDNQTGDVFSCDNTDFNIINMRPVSGLVCYILFPRIETEEEKDHHEIKIVFRGTKCLAGALRDIEDAPGSDSFAQAKMVLIQTIYNIAHAVSKNKTTLSFSIYGHSLGGADAQNLFVALMETINSADSTTCLGKVTKLTLNAFNSSGVRQQMADDSLILATALKNKYNNLSLNLNWCIAAGDGVQQTGEANILATATAEIANVTLLKVFPKKSGEYIWSSGWNVIQAAWALLNTKQAHSAQLFNSHKNNHGMDKDPEYYSNNNDPEAIISQKLNKKSNTISSVLYLTTSIRRAIATRPRPDNELKTNIKTMIDELTRQDVRITELNNIDVIKKGCIHNSPTCSSLSSAAGNDDDHVDFSTPQNLVSEIPSNNSLNWKLAGVENKATTPMPTTTLSVDLHRHTPTSTLPINVARGRPQLADETAEIEHHQQNSNAHYSGSRNSDH